MGSLADLAVTILTQAQRRVEIAGQNIANATTPAYKRRVSFSTLVGGDQTGDIAIPKVNSSLDFRSGKLTSTGNPTDIAISGPGYFALRRDDHVIYSRQGQFTADEKGRLVDAQGFALQLTNGGDLALKSARFEVRDNGTVVEDGMTLGRIAVFAADDQNGFEAINGGFLAGRADLQPAEDVSIRQGMVEASNVSVGDEMIVMMEALRRAESGQRVMNVYDDLMGRVITSFGDAVR
jgi:flagellar basal-body rod protein FlgF